MTYKIQPIKWNFQKFYSRDELLNMISSATENGREYVELGPAKAVIGVEEVYQFTRCERYIRVRMAEDVISLDTGRVCGMFFPRFYQHLREGVE